MAVLYRKMHNYLKLYADRLRGKYLSIKKISREKNLSYKAAASIINLEWLGFIPGQCPPHPP